MKKKKEDLRELAPVINFEKLLQSDIVKREVQELLNRTTREPVEVNKMIFEEISILCKPLLEEARRQISQVMTDGKIEIINQTVKAYEKRINTEKEMKGLTNQVQKLAESNTEDQITEMELQYKILEKEEELKADKKELLKIFKQAVDETQFTAELIQIINNIKEIHYDILSQIDKEMELAAAREKALKMVYSHINILENTYSIISKDICTPVNGRDILTSKERSFINLLIKNPTR